MKLKLILWYGLFLLSYKDLNAQAGCSAIGQTPGTAFPVCGTTVFEQKQVPICGNTSLYVPGCSGASGAAYSNKNPYWYKFTCYQSGTLGFEIKPKDPADDYDWQLYDITGLSPESVFTNKNIIVSGNWAGNPGNTGTSSAGVAYIQCASPYDGNEPRYARMPNLIQGHQYLLLVSHFSDNQSGYDLSFGGGTAVITDPRQPDLLSLNYSCDAATIFIKTNKKIKCESLAVDGSDFIISNSTANVISARAVCAGFDTDTLILKLDRSLPVGSYNVVIRKGSDGNTLLDNCGNSIPEGNLLPLVVTPIQPTPMDSLKPVQCAPGKLNLVFSKKIRCNSVSPDGSDFLVAGPVPVSVSGIEMQCDTAGLSNVISIVLSEPLVHGGNYRIVLRSGTDGNTIYDECAQETPANSFLSFSIKDTVNADFNYRITGGCDRDVVELMHDGRHGVNNWQWQLDYNGTSNLQNPQTTFLPYGDKKIVLVVTNGFCSDTAAQTISLGSMLKADFEADNIVCPNDTIHFINRSSGDIVRYDWDLGNGIRSLDGVPLNVQYPQLPDDKIYRVSLIVQNGMGCKDTAIADIKVLMTCNIDVPNAFTPNGDGLNDYLYPLNAVKADNLVFRVYNRAGQLLFETHDWLNKWDGTFKGDPQDAGVYAWTLHYNIRGTDKSFFKKGTATLIR